MIKMTHGGILLNTFSLASKTIRFCKLRKKKKKVTIIHSTFTSSHGFPFCLSSLPLSLSLSPSLPLPLPLSPSLPLSLSLSLSLSPYFPISRGKAGKAVSFKYRCVKLPILATQSGILHNKIVDLLT